MRHKRLLAPLLLAVLLGLMAGCGGSGSSKSVGTRKVTIQITWPSAANKSVSRVVLSSIKSALVEVYDGSNRIGVVKFTQGSTLTPSTATLDLPIKGLTFFANAFSAATAPDYVTNPANGQLEKGTPGALVPLASVDANGASTDARPVTHSVALVDVATLLPTPSATQGASVNFTWNNTIASLVPTTTTLTLDRTAPNFDLTNETNPNVDVTNLIQAKSVDGSNLFLAAGALTAVNDPNDTLGSMRAGFVPNTTTLNLKTSGTVRVIVTDSQVNSGGAFQQKPIQATITYDILPSTPAVSVPLNVNTGSVLLNSLPFYARSVRYTVKQTALVDTVGSNHILDNPPTDVSVVQTTTFTAPNTIVVNGGTTLPLQYVYSGRAILITADAYSNTDGTGVILAHGEVSYDRTTAPITTTTQNITLAPRVSGFKLTPANPTITLVNPSNSANSATTISLNTANLVVSAIVSNPADANDPVYVVVDPHTLNVGAFDPTAMTPTPSGIATAVASTDTSAPAQYPSNTFVRVTGTQNGTANVAVSDRAGKNGSTTLTVQYATGISGVNIH